VRGKALAATMPLKEQKGDYDSGDLEQAQRCCFLLHERL
jgi:hypothetical protein